MGLSPRIRNSVAGCPCHCFPYPARQFREAGRHFHLLHRSSGEDPVGIVAGPPPQFLACHLEASLRFQDCCRRILAEPLCARRGPFSHRARPRRRQPWTEDRCRLSLWHRGYFAGVRRMTTDRELGGGHGDLGQHMVRTGARPLQTERRPRYWPMSRFSGATPTGAAISCPLRHPKSDSSEESMVAMTDSRQADCAATRYGIARPGLSAIGLGVPGSRPPVRPCSQSRVRHEAVMLT